MGPRYGEGLRPRQACDRAQSQHHALGGRKEGGGDIHVDRWPVRDQHSAGAIDDLTSLMLEPLSLHEVVLRLDPKTLALLDLQGIQPHSDHQEGDRDDHAHDHAALVGHRRVAVGMSIEPHAVTLPSFVPGRQLKLHPLQNPKYGPGENHRRRELSGHRGKHQAPGNRLRAHGIVNHEPTRDRPGGCHRRDRGDH